MLSKIRLKISHYIDIIYNRYYPLTIIRRKRLRKQIINKNFTLLAGNCIGGYIYHQLGLPFNSPTINLMILNQDFKKLVLNLDYYLKITPVPCFDSRYPDVPSAILGDIILHFTHYESVEAGIHAWEKRKKRVDLNNLYIIISDIDLSDKDIEELQYAKCKKIIVMTSKKYNYEHCLYLPAFQGLPQVGNLLVKTIWGKWKFEQYFDFVDWFNSDNINAQNFYIR